MGMRSVRVVDIGGIVDIGCLNFLSLSQSCRKKGDTGMHGLQSPRNLNVTRKEGYILG
jgi:hypothetical protein